VREKPLHYIACAADKQGNDTMREEPAENRFQNKREYACITDWLEALDCTLNAEQMPWFIQIYIGMQQSLSICADFEISINKSY